MKSKLAVLVRCQVIEQFRLRTLRGKRLAGAVLLGLMISGSVGLMGGGLAYSLCVAGLGELTPTMMVAMTGMISLVFTVTQVKGTLFGFSGFDLMFSMPVGCGHLVASRFIVMALGGWALSLVLTLPAAAVHLVMTGAGAQAYIAWIVIALTQTLLPTALGALVGSALIALSARFRYANWAAIVLTFALFVAYFVGVSQLSAFDESEFMLLANLTGALGAPLEKIYPPARLARQAVEGSTLSLVGFVGLSAAVYTLLALVVSRYYANLNSALTARARRDKFVLGRARKRSQLRALLAREAKHYVSATGYVINTGMGLVMALMLGVAALLWKDRLALVLMIPGVRPWVAGGAPFLLAAILSTVCTTAVALSLEGKSLWLVQSAPVTPGQVLRAKVLFNLCLTAPTALVASGMLNRALGGGAADFARMFLVALGFSLLSATGGMLINLKFPRYEWESETQVVKQSLSSMLGILGGMLVALAPLAATIWGGLDPNWAALGFGALALVAGVALWALMGRVKRL